ncbi:taxon MazF [Enterobacteriaceae bacterium 89]|nr:taxon MazF [Enterobacteriaceae bacterium 89]
MEQFCAYENLGAGKGAYSVLVNLQHPVANVLKHVLVAPAVECAKFEGRKLPAKLCPVIPIDGQDYAVLVHMAAGIPEKQIGQKIADLTGHRTALRDALDFLINGY